MLNDQFYNSREKGKDHLYSLVFGRRQTGRKQCMVMTFIFTIVAVILSVEPGPAEIVVGDAISQDTNWVKSEAPISNSESDPFMFTIDSFPPEKPVITGGTTLSGIIEERPAENVSDQFILELTGTRETGTSVWINGVEMVTVGDADWSIQLPLSPGDNTFEIWLEDTAGNQGASAWVDIRVFAETVFYYEYDNSGRLKTVR